MCDKQQPPPPSSNYCQSYPATSSSNSQQHQSRFTSNPNHYHPYGHYQKLAPSANNGRLTVRNPVQSSGISKALPDQNNNNNNNNNSASNSQILEHLSVPLTNLTSHPPSLNSNFDLDRSSILPSTSSSASSSSSSSFNNPVPATGSVSGSVTNSSNNSNKRIFSKELRCMMYGFGDDQNPYTESVDMVEDLVLQFITDIAIKALNSGDNDKIAVEDLFFILRKDPKKYSRLKDLLEMNHELRQARKAFDEIKYLGP